MIPLHLFVSSLLGWLQWEPHAIIQDLRKENRVLKAQLRHPRLRLSDDDRRRLAALGASLGRPILAQVATLVTPDPILDGTGGTSPGRRQRLVASSVTTIVRRSPAAQSRLGGVFGHYALAKRSRSFAVTLPALRMELVPFQCQEPCIPCDQSFRASPVAIGNRADDLDR